MEEETVSMALTLGNPIIGCAPSLSVPDGEPTKKIDTAVLLSVEYLKVVGPEDRDDDLCSIYGHVRVSDREMDAKTAVTLFDLKRDDAEIIYLADPDFQFLTLSDGTSARPVLGCNPLYIHMKLWEKIEDGEEMNDPVLVDVNFKFDGMYKTNKRRIFEFEGDSGFDFYLAYSHIYGGVSAEVRFTIIKDIASQEEEGSTTTDQDQLTLTGKRKHPIPPTLIYGTIGASQAFSNDEVTAIKLFYAHDPVQVDIGSPIMLLRKLVVAPTDGGSLSIGYSLFNGANDQLFTRSAVPFCLHRDAGVVTAPENLTYTQESIDGFVSVSIKLVPLERVE